MKYISLVNTFVKNNKPERWIMSTNVETMRMTKVYGTDLHHLQRVNAESDICKRRWLQKYSHRLLRLWLQWQSPLGVTSTYVEQIEEDLANFYDEPLKRIFIETTYH